MDKRDEIRSALWPGILAHEPSHKGNYMTYINHLEVNYKCASYLPHYNILNKISKI